MESWTWSNERESRISFKWYSLEFDNLFIRYYHNHWDCIIYYLEISPLETNRAVQIEFSSVSWKGFVWISAGKKRFHVGYESILLTGWISNRTRWVRKISILIFQKFQNWKYTFDTSAKYPKSRWFSNLGFKSWINRGIFDLENRNMKSIKWNREILLRWWSGWKPRKAESFTYT